MKYCLLRLSLAALISVPSTTLPSPLYSPTRTPGFSSSLSTSFHSFARDLGGTKKRENKKKKINSEVYKVKSKDAKLEFEVVPIDSMTLELVWLVS